ncbi:TonB-dependent receptor [Bizionia myxarmorum]|uniref:TonB-dependent receptor plug domain-containing protein n=1 Tax=Bizionia myxarmorum TaxID=291186 RepID=A0A5D0RCP5_9FLAO|nr:TonB-dependent receptor [Bizionia myxarmorum]TYB78488.1 TonB-dependent receptor plug domain-containing protein [Bizionia myxarmorum]
MKYLLLNLIIFTSFLAHANNPGSLVGKLTDKEYNNEPLPYANVIIKGSTKGTTTDMDGLYSIDNLEPGTYTIVFSFVGYQTQEIEANIIAGKVTEINLPMAISAASLDEVIITTTIKRESEIALLLDQKKAVEIKQSIGAEELSRKGVSNAAGAVAKISGVSKQEGSSNVYVRGLGDRYLNTTLNGLSLPSNDVNKKNINLDLFSSDIIENISISKAYSTKFYGDFSAGNVNINSKDYTGNGFLDVFTGTGFNTNAISQDFVRSEGTGYFGYYGRNDHNPFAVVLSHGIDPVSAGTPINVSYGASAGKSIHFKDGSRISFFATAAFENGFEYRQGTTRDFTLTEKKAFVDSAEEYEYGTTTTAMASINYKIDNSNTIKYNSVFINNSSDVVGYFGTNGNGRNRDAIQNTDEGFYQMNVQFDQTKMFVNQLLGTHKSGKIEVDWGFGYNYVNADQPDRKRISLENYHFALDNNPATNPIFYSNVDYDNQRYFQKITDDEYNGNINFAYDVSEKAKLNIGYNGKSKTRDFNNIRYGYDILQGNTPVTDVHNFNSIFSLSNLQTNQNTDGIYEIKVIKPTPGYSNTNSSGLSENTYQGRLDVYAGYINAELKVGDNWLFVPGVRFESFEQYIAFDVINLGLKGIDNIITKDNLFLPSLNVKYSINEDQNLRFSASQTASLPEFKEVAPFVYEDISTRVGGNPDLLEKGFSKIYNVDFKYDWFFSNSEILSLGTFAKIIKNPINLVVGADATGTQRYFRTGDKATVYGFEVEVRKNIITDENDNTNLSVGLNATYMHTSQDLYSRIDGEFYDVSFNKTKENLQGASPFLLNADISYSPTFKNYKPVANLVFSYFSDRIDALGSGQLGNVIEKGLPTLDFIWKNSFKNNFEVNLSVMNLLNPTVKYIRETTLGDIVVNSSNGKGVTDYKRGMDVGLQLKYSF